MAIKILIIVAQLIAVAVVMIAPAMIIIAREEGKAMKAEIEAAEKERITIDDLIN